MIMPYLVGFGIGVMFTLLTGSYAVSAYYEYEIKRDLLVQELMKENNSYRDSIDNANGEMNKDYWG